MTEYPALNKNYGRGVTNIQGINRILQLYAAVPVKLQHSMAGSTLSLVTDSR
jgi:hypothetical protein